MRNWIRLLETRIMAIQPELKSEAPGYVDDAEADTFVVYDVTHGYGQMAMIVGEFSTRKEAVKFIQDSNAQLWHGDETED